METGQALVRAAGCAMKKPALAGEATKDETKMDRLGLAGDRLLDAMFTADTLPRLLQNWREQPGAIDQSNLARFLATVMSTETCRKVAVACGTAGFLNRER